MARKPRQDDLPGTESPNRDPELHALGMELYDLQNERVDLTKREKEKRGEIAAALHERKQEEYDCDGVHLWIEKGDEKVRVKVGVAVEDEED
jgi:hypothetical protein